VCLWPAPPILPSAVLRSRSRPHNHDLIAFDNFTQNGEWRFAGARRTVIRFEPRLLTDSVEAAIDAAIDGLGITRVLSYQVACHVREGRLTYLLAPLDPPAVPVNLLFQANRQRSPNVRALLGASRRYFTEQSIV
jgi:DNA-binding transcriptional LysR family regulator